MSTPVATDRIDREVNRVMLMNVAYRLLGSMADAEDVAQETYVRWYKMTESERDAIRTPAAWCVRVATRICLDTLTSARHRREQYIGPWLPEPVPGQRFLAMNSASDPADLVAVDEHITMAMLVVLESMTPAERVCFVLHDVFRFPFSDISEIVGRSGAACRQLATSARRRVDSGHPCPRDARQHSATTVALTRAFQRGDIKTLVTLLDPDVSVINDGGGLVRAALRPIVGVDRVVRYLTGIRDREADVHTSVVDVNGQAGLRMQRAGVTIAVAVLEVRNGLITRVWVVRNSEKLRYWNDEYDGAAQLSCEGAGTP